MRREPVIVDDLAHMAQDLGGGCDRRASPRLEAIAEGIEVTIGAYPGIAMRDPGAAEGILRFERDKARAGALFCQMVGGADAGNAGPDDQHVKVLGLLDHAGRGHYRDGHWVSAFFFEDSRQLSLFRARVERRVARPDGCDCRAGMEDSAHEP